MEKKDKLRRIVVSNKMLGIGIYLGIVIFIPPLAFAVASNNIGSGIEKGIALIGLGITGVGLSSIAAILTHK